MTDQTTPLNLPIPELEVLNRLVESLGSTTKVDEILATIVDSSLKLCRAERAAIVLFDPSSREVAQTLVRSADASQGNIDHSLNLLLAGWIERHKKPLLAKDLVEQLQLTEASDRLLRLGPALAVPLVFAGKTLGVINLVNSRGGAEFSEELLGIATVIATLAAQFIQKTKIQETLFEDNLRLKNALQQKYGLGSMIGQSSVMRGVFEKIALVSASSANVLLIGETGTGKELVARALHFRSNRAEKPFVAINCAAIPASLVESELFGHERGAFTGATNAQKGKFELADHGTLFLDEISEMPLEIQPKLLRILEDRSFYPVGSSSELRVDVRVIAASSRDLDKTVREGKFREDLFHRLNVVPIYLPPLRERPEDIPLLAHAFLEEFSGGAQHFASDTLEKLSKLEWRGNVRELRNIIERISILVRSKEITPSHLYTVEVAGDVDPTSPRTSALPAFLRSHESGGDLPEAVEKTLLELALSACHGNVNSASRLLGIDRKALQRRIEKYGIPRK
jgi:Nif-specific regulatory protein